jgi:hypothetical protein
MLNTATAHPITEVLGTNHNARFTREIAGANSERPSPQWAGKFSSDLRSTCAMRRCIPLSYIIYTYCIYISYVRIRAVTHP